MHKATPSAFGGVRRIAEGKNQAAGFDGPDVSNYDAQGGTPRDAPDVSHGMYKCNVQGTITQTPSPSKSIKDPFSG